MNKIIIIFVATIGVLLSGNHQEIEKWFLSKREAKTKKLRKDLWKNYRSKKNGVENG